VEGSESETDQTFEVSGSPESALASPENEGVNVCRVAALATMLGGDRQAVRELAPELLALGFSDRLGSGEYTWTDIDSLEAFGQLERPGDDDRRARITRWQMISETPTPAAAVAFLVAVLGSELERESAAAAAALWRQITPLAGLMGRGPRVWHIWDRLYDVWERDWPDAWWWGAPFSPAGPSIDGDIDEVEGKPWEPEEWTRLYGRVMSRLGDPYANVVLVGLLVRLRLTRALESSDHVTRSFAAAAFPPTPTGASAAPPARAVAIPPGALVVSTMIHGTWGWKGKWWRPGDGFHRFIRDSYRPNLYSRGAKFSWSGAYSESQRQQAADDFRDWGYEVAPNGLQTVFAHSYGAEVAARARLSGSRASELVLLSAPVTDHVEAAAAIPDLRIVDIRLRFDPVLGLARTRQRIKSRPNVTPVVLDQWRLDHSSTHDELVWRSEDIARRGHI
jgi:hypothetical protein